MKHIRLSNGQFAVVDDDNFDRLNNMGQWHMNASGYAVLYVTDSNGKRDIIYTHRLVLELALGHPLGSLQADHRNAIRLDQSISNLRAVTASANQASKSNQKNSTSGQKGVNLRRGAYDVRLRYYHHRITVGRYKDFDLAVRIYRFAHRLLWGEAISEGEGEITLPADLEDKIETQIAAFLMVVPPV